RNRHVQRVAERTGEHVFARRVAHQDFHSDAYTGIGDTRRVDDADGDEVGVVLQDAVPQVQVARTRFTDHHRPFCGVGGLHGRQRALRHAVLRPDTVDVGQRGEEVAHHLLAGRLIPLAAFTTDDVDAGILGEDLRDAFHARLVAGMADEAFDQHDVAFTAQLLGQPSGADLGPFRLVDDDVDDALSGDLLVDGDDDDAGLGGFLKDGVEGVLVVG